jgi:hypothetical protein
LQLLERVLFVWAKEHPIIEYFQGLGDTFSQFLVVFIGAITGTLHCSMMCSQRVDIDNFPKKTLTEEQFQQLEVDTYWCSKLLLDSMMVMSCL